MSNKEKQRRLEDASWHAWRAREKRWAEYKQPKRCRYCGAIANAPGHYVVACYSRSRKEG